MSTGSNLCNGSDTRNPSDTVVVPDSFLRCVDRGSGAGIGVEAVGRMTVECAVECVEPYILQGFAQPLHCFAELVSRAERFTASNRMSYGDHLMYPTRQTPYLS
jgi:hypothetical protein